MLNSPSKLIRGTALKASSLSNNNQAHLSQDKANSAGSNTYLSLNIFPIATSLEWINAYQSNPLIIYNFSTEDTNSDAKIALSLY